MEEKKYGLSSAALKYIAMTTMFIDHLGAGIIELNIKLLTKYHNIDRIFRMIGRLAFPIFCFLLVEGFLHTKNVKKYISRLVLFAFISEVPFDLAFYNKYIEFSHQNVMFTLALSVLMLYYLDKYKLENGKKLITILAFSGIALLIRCDYSAFGILLVALMYIYHQDKVTQTRVCAIMLIWEITAVLALVPIKFYNGKLGRNIKYFTYIFYPLHLFIIFLVRENMIYNLF